MTNKTLVILYFSFHTVALSLSGSVGSDEIGFILFSNDLAYSLAVFNLNRYKSLWKVLCIAAKEPKKSINVIFLGHWLLTGYFMPKIIFEWTDTLFLS